MLSTVITSSETTNFHKDAPNLEERAVFFGGVDLHTYQLLGFVHAGKAADVTLPGDTHTATPAKSEHNHSPKTTPRLRWKKTESEELISCTECSRGFQSVYTTPETAI